ncbi:MAG: PepSY domain-containing protein [Pusillimonas sp.]|nr:PepSY domain-containing protein [Pusillimonas sp.]
MMFKSFRKLAIITALGSAGIAALGLPVYAQNNVNAPQTSSAAAETSKNWLGMRDILTQLESSGYTDIREMEREKSGYKVKARNQNGQMVKLYIEPINGNITREKIYDADPGDRYHDSLDGRHHDNLDDRQHNHHDD